MAKGGRPSYQKTKDRPITSDFIAGITVNTHCKLLVCNFTNSLHISREPQHSSREAAWFGRFHMLLQVLTTAKLRSLDLIHVSSENKRYST